VTVQAQTVIRSAARRETVFEVEQFLYAEAELLDQWRLHEWLELFTPDGYYEVPSTDLPDGDASRDLFIIHDDRFLLEQRVNSLLTRAGHAEYPHSSTRRLISNVRVNEEGDGRLQVSANFMVHRFRSGDAHVYVGHYRSVIERADTGELRYVLRGAVLSNDVLRPQGKVSIIL
jgi:p-cumate 2,3-dioxygenase beta subunit